MLKGCAWPSQQDFVQRHMDFTLASVTPGQQVKWLRVLHKEATQIVERLGAVQLVLQPPGGVRRLLPHLGCKSGVKTCLVPAIPRSALLRVVWTPTPPTKPHPMTIHSQRVGDEQIKAYVKYSKHLRKILLPVFEDLQFRLAFRLLQVRSRFWFLEASNPGIQRCVRDGCDAIETEKHLFFECVLATQLWEHMRMLVAPLLRSQLTWTTVATATKPVVRDEWRECEDIVCDVRHTLRAVTLHFLWSDRNRCLFDGRQPTPAIPAMSIIFATASAHFRHSLRRRYDADQQTTQQTILAKMTQHQGFKEFMGKNPTALCVRHREV